MIKEYFKKIENSLEKFNHIIEDYIINKKTFTREKGSIDGEVFFSDESRMDFLEVVNTNKQSKEKYAYHYMDKDNSMIFRYDNAHHHREIKTFPHHKHIQNNIEESTEPNISNVLNEIEDHIIDKK